MFQTIFGIIRNPFMGTRFFYARGTFIWKMDYKVQITKCVCLSLCYFQFRKKFTDIFLELCLMMLAISNTRYFVLRDSSLRKIFHLCHKRNVIWSDNVSYSQCGKLSYLHASFYHIILFMVFNFFRKLFRFNPIVVTFICFSTLVNMPLTSKSH